MLNNNKNNNGIALKRAEKLSDVLRNLNKDKNELSFQAL